LASGAKMGKTEKGAIWLDKKLLSAYEYWQFWRNIDDKDVFKFLQMFTDLDLNEIQNLKNKNEDINQLKILLANLTTKMLHGEKASNNAEQTAKNTFEDKSFGMDLPTVKINKETITKGINIINLVILSNISNSKSEIRRFIKNRGIRLNNKIIEDEKTKILFENFDDNNSLKLSHGKKRHIIFKIN